MASGAGAVTSIDVRPYLNDTVGIGATDPGNPGSVLCLVFQDGAVPTYGGKVNGSVVAGRTGELNVTFTNQSFAQVASCVSTAINISTVDATNIAVQATAPKTGGTLQISTIASVQPGISATATTQVRVNYAAGQVVKAPSGAIVIGGALSGDTHVDFSLKPVATITKASLNLTACSDNQYLIDSNTPDGNIKSNAPKATKLDLVTPFSTTPKLGDAGVYVATIRDCAENTATVPGKASTTKILLTGPGAANVQFLKSSTDNPSVWDTTFGTSCATVKTAGTFGTGLQSSRVMQCKGNYGAPIPLSLTVRGWVASGAGFKDSYGVGNTDADGAGPTPAVAIHAAPPVTILSHTFT